MIWAKIGQWFYKAIVLISSKITFNWFLISYPQRDLPYIVPRINFTSISTEYLSVVCCERNYNDSNNKTFRLFYELNFRVNLSYIQCGIRAEKRMNKFRKFCSCFFLSSKTAHSVHCLCNAKNERLLINSLCDPFFKKLSKMVNGDMFHLHLQLDTARSHQFMAFCCCGCRARRSTLPLL